MIFAFGKSWCSIIVEIFPKVSSILGRADARGDFAYLQVQICPYSTRLLSSSFQKTVFSLLFDFPF